jgi:hypothetical protein
MPLSARSQVGLSETIHYAHHIHSGFAVLDRKTCRDGFETGIVTLFFNELSDLDAFLSEADKLRDELDRTINPDKYAAQSPPQDSGDYDRSRPATDHQFRKESDGTRCSVCGKAEEEHKHNRMLVVIEGVEGRLEGPYKDDEDRMNAAIKIDREVGEDVSGIHWLDVWGEASMGDFSGAEMHPEESKKPIDAVVRAMAMMQIPMVELPKLARDYVRHLSSKLGLCGEVYLTAYAHYAQCVDGLPCVDIAYFAGPDAQDWFASHNQETKP